MGYWRKINMRNNVLFKLKTSLLPEIRKKPSLLPLYGNCLYNTGNSSTKTPTQMLYVNGAVCEAIYVKALIDQPWL